MNIRKNFLKPTLIAGALAASLALSVPLYAHAFGGGEGGGAMMHCEGGMMHGEGGMGGPEGHAMGMPFIHQLKLSEAQRDQIFKIMHEQAPAMREKAKEARKIHEELHALAFSAQYDEAKVKTLSESAARSMAEMAQMHLKSANQIYLLLTPEQRKKAEELKAEFETHGPRHHRDGARPEPRDAKRG